jgi:uncharacterized membrane protein required for colicin V production
MQMTFDILIAAIVVLSMVFGYRKGFLLTLAHSVGWLGSIVLSIVLYPHATRFLNGRAGYVENLHDNIVSRFRGNMFSSGDELFESVPSAVASNVESAARDLTLTLADSIAAVCYNIIIFIFLVVGIKILAYVFTRLASNFKASGLAAGLDKLLGLILGGVKGMVAAYVFLALILPVSLFISRPANEFVESTLFSSIFARDMYDNNPLLLIAANFLNF